MSGGGLSSPAEAALRERVKELTCLYGIAQIASHPRVSTEEILTGIVGLLPPAWQYPEITGARIVVDGREVRTSLFCESAVMQSAPISVAGEKRGSVEVIYTERRPQLDDGPFLQEERKLIDAVANQVGQILERREAEEDRLHLQDQLRHADRLATIGLLAAGVAHELNEPLGNVLGFAQLAGKSKGLPPQVKSDLEKIETAALHARNVIKNLLVFARQVPSRRTSVDLNEVVENGLYFFEARCSKDGIELRRSLVPDLPLVTGDPSQLNQVLVNLIVNALQAMPDGGTLEVRTQSEDDHVSLIVQDSGVGMTEEIMKEIFIPFFTTKEVGQGTGLGLPVVHGIVAQHGGSLIVESKPGQGTQFEIRLPRADSKSRVET